MKRVGTVERVAQGLAVVRAPDDDYPDLGTRVLTEALDEVGDLVDVFGPVERPYLAIAPDGDVHVATLVGDALYAR